MDGQNENQVIGLPREKHILLIHLQPLHNPFNMSIHHSLLTSSALQILQIRSWILKKVLCQYCYTKRFPEQVEPLLPVHITVWHVGSDETTWEVLDCCLAKTVSESIRLCLSFACIDTQSVSIEPFRAVSGGFDMNPDQDDILRAISRL